MSTAIVYNVKGEKVKDLELDAKVFGVKINPDVISQAVIAQQANARYNLANVKDRSAVAGGGKKPWRQKGTGRARHGSIRSPLWRGGGITFGPSTEQNFSIKINRKVRTKAILMSLSDKAVNEKIILLDKFEATTGKTKQFFDILKSLKLRQKTDKTAKRILVVLPKKDATLLQAIGNIERVEVIKADSLNVVDVLKANYLLMPVDSLEVVAKTFVK